MTEAEEIKFLKKASQEEKIAYIREFRMASQAETLLAKKETEEVLKLYTSLYWLIDEAETAFLNRDFPALTLDYIKRWGLTGENQVKLILRGRPEEVKMLKKVDSLTADAAQLLVERKCV